jgi:hypothetical protein
MSRVDAEVIGLLRARTRHVVAMRMHSTFETGTVSTERQYFNSSPWTQAGLQNQLCILTSYDIGMCRRREEVEQTIHSK